MISSIVHKLTWCKRPAAAMLSRSIENQPKETSSTTCTSRSADINFECKINCATNISGNLNRCARLANIVIYHANKMM